MLVGTVFCMFVFAGVTATQCYTSLQNKKDGSTGATKVLFQN